MQSTLRLQLLAGLVVSSSAFSCTPAPSSATLAQRTTSAVALPITRPVHRVSRLATVQMGLFGLGAPELAVIGLVALVIVGPDQLKVFAKDLGKMTPELKEVAAEAAESFKESSGEALKDVKENAAPALAEFKDAVSPGLEELKDSALKEAMEVAGSFQEGASKAVAPDARSERKKRKEAEEEVSSSP